MTGSIKKTSATKIHKEGYNIIAFFGIFLIFANIVFYYFLNNYHIIDYSFTVISAIFFTLVILFFRVPRRVLFGEENKIYAPADGKIVVIEQVFEKEYFKDYRTQVSIFMSPFNVHVNWVPVSGVVQYLQYHPGNYFVAWKPKASEENERFTTVFKTKDNIEILMRQIAGKIARRIVSYAKTETEYKSGEQIGIIKFGSRVDIFLPSNAKILVELNQKVKGNKTLIAEL
ncbi:MAG: phosphatidylserine decarboxylase [Bacteroidetes bacterium GWA2_32_17]|nr:MAG: phosphatidylserine decarboxylase [Bacteroidetes bacterium GWA2_32_17]